MTTKYALFVFIPLCLLLCGSAFYVYGGASASDSVVLVGMVALAGLSSWFIRGAIAARSDNRQELHDNTDRLRKYFELSGVGIGKTSTQGRWLEADDTLCNLLGYSEQEFKVISWSDTVYPDDLHMIDHLLDLTVSGEVDHLVTSVRFVNRAGGVVFAELVSLCVRQDDGAVDYFDHYVVDGGEREKISQSLRASVNQHRRLFEEAPLMYVLTRIGDPSPTIADANKRFLEELGYSREEVVGKESTLFYTAESNEQMLSGGYRQAMEGTFTPQERQLVAEDGRIVETILYALPEYDSKNEVVGTRAIYVDVGTRRALEEEHRKSQNLEALGVLAGGIAHDFNNVLTAVIGSFELLELITEDKESKTYGIIANGKNAAERTRGLTQQLMTFAKGGAPVKQASSMKDLIRETTELLLRGSKTVPVFDIDEDLYAVNVDYGQMGQVVQNLVINADQAMSEGGTLKLTAKNLHISAGDSIQYFHLLEAGPYVRVTVEDEGVGLSDEALKKIFDPYYTTKETGHGLGLSIVHSIIHRHDGYITARSEKGRGAAFEFYIPAIPDSTLEKEVSEETLHAGKGRILLVDDEEAVHATVPLMLEQFGYQVEDAYGGEEAITLYREAMEAGNGYDLVIMDLTMPGGMDGQEAVKKLHELDADVRAIVSSGYASNRVMNDYEDYGFIASVKKPVNMAELIKTVGEVIGETA
ncbi:MAG: ATP-binding protein [Candidatus Latescibacterota bacterium]